ncbi:hypothetical protein O3Q52_41685 [Streptomyces sp. ActVer]|uniref:hypothetical protein n=1 Tax=Streptomyces sp. ActVer TaxID=3014558 RepID=UPI0022B4D529|nr:hypothetical protein [Streptomyces sp. ActVer]MCZ4514536.1 hypothetical protein [Streptomyces sp. ActVer]
MNLKEAAAREAYLKTLLDVVGDAYKAARVETRQALETADQESGTRQVAVSLPGGPDIATVSLSSGSAEARVVDADAYTAWVLQYFGSEIERKFVTGVRKAFTDRLLKQMTAAGRTEWPDPETGVIHEVPGVEIAGTRSRTHSVRFKEHGRDKVMTAWREGRLATVALPQLTAGGAE